MIKVLFVIVFVALALTLSINGSAFGYTINDITATSYVWGPLNNGDRIGDATFELYRMTVNQNEDDLIIDIFTNYPSTGYQVGSWFTRPADLAIDLDGINGYEYGVILANRTNYTAGSIYGNVTSWYTSNNFCPGSGYTYNTNQVVRIANGNKIGNTAVSWNPLDTDPYHTTDVNPNYQIHLALNDFIPDGFAGNVGVFFGNATCANDYVGGKIPVSNPVPEPATMSLLGLGLFGLLFRKRKS